VFSILKKEEAAGMRNLAEKTEETDRYFTYADYKQWELKEGERYELINGVAYALAVPNTAHQAISGEVSRQIANYLHGKPCKVFSAPFDVRLFFDEDENDDTVVQPDISVICDSKKLGPEGCRGAPNLVIEILSPSNSIEEYVRKLNLYLKAGVREFWVVSPDDKIVQVTIFKEDANTWKIYEAGAILPSTAIEGLSVNLSEVFAEQADA
jgi:Uma2 family endonuclease